MNTLENMKKILSESGAYLLTGETPVDNELSAYAAGFSELESGLSKLTQDIFALTANEEVLELWEKLFRPQASSAEREVRQRMAANLLASHLTALNEEDYKAILESAGLKGCLKENNEALTIYFGEFLGLTEAEVLKELDRVLPAHLLWEMVREFNWLSIDARRRSFAEWDALSLTWAELDALTWDELQT